ncbi:MAG: SNF2-related protein, partial [Acidaminobacteraceae bacterium]
MKFLNFTDSYNYQVTDTVSGWKIGISDKNGHVRLPLILDDKIDKKLSKSPKSSAIMLVSDLLSESLIYEKNYELYMEVDIYWCLTESERNIIGLPVIYSEDIKLESHCAIGVSDFNVNAYVYDNGQFTKSYVQKNHILRTESDTRVLDNHQIQIFDDLKKISNAKETLEQFEAVAKLKTDALKSNIIFDDYLESEEINFADGFDVDVEVINPSEIRLLPRFDSLNENQNSIVNNSEIKTYYNENRADGKKTRVFLKDSEVENIRSLEEINIIKDFDVPKFLENPISYIGDAIDFDMSKFSERVKGIKIHKYKAQPFIHVNESESLNWFDLDIGIRLDSGDDENESKELDLESFLELVEEAEENDGFARLGDGWLEIDTQQARSFIDAIERVGNTDDDALNSSINIAGLQKILEIFENIQKLEYNQGFFNVVEKLKDSGLDKYIRPEGLNVDLYKYQKEGHIWMKSLDIISAGGLMADDMGLGKTVQVISYLQSLKNIGDILPTLI